MFASNARNSAARDAAEKAKSDAAENFVALDEVQKDVTMVIEAFARLDAGQAGQRLVAEMEPLNEAADAASQSWIDSLDQHDKRLEQPDASARELQDAERAFGAAHTAMYQAREKLLQFKSRHPDVEQRIQAAFAEVQPKVSAAQRALEAARGDVARAQQAGIHSDDLAARLAEAERLAVPVTEGAHRHGALATLDNAAKAAAAADAVTSAARELLAVAEETPRRLGSTRTRLQGVEGRLEQLPPTLSNLRRRYSMACSTDLDHIPEEATRQVADARQLLDRAQRASDGGAWEEAARLLTQGRAQLGDAEDGVNRVVQRLRDLDAVAADPAEEKARTRFAVRDAQALVVSVRDRVPANEVTVLDSLAARLDKVDEKLTTAAHPDYWAYLVELRAITDVAQSVVRRVRAAMAG